MDSPVVVITGASGGIGEATARCFAARGWTVVLAARSGDKLARLAADIEAAGGSALAVPADVTVPRDRARLVAATEQAYGRVDALINNAGMGLAGTVDTLDMQDLEYVFRLNVLAPVALLQAVVPLMRRQGGGVIVNVSSLSEALPAPYIGGYGASKAALGHLTEAAGAELARDHIAVVKVMPGLTATGFQKHTRESGVGLSPSQLLGKANFMAPMPPERVAAAIWSAVLTRRSRRCFTASDWVLCRLTGLAPGLVSRLFRAAVQRYVSPTGEPSQANIKRDLRDLGLIIGGAAATLAALVGGIWVWVKERAT